MNTRSFISVALFLSLATACFGLSAEVKIQINQQQYYFNQPVRLSEVLQPVALDNPWYWTAAKLYRTDTPSVELQRQAVLEKLAVTAGEVDEPVALGLQRLRVELSKWELAERLLHIIDYDLARADQRFNPNFSEGTFKLILTERPAHVYFFGALNNSVRLPHQGAKSVSDYLQYLDMSPGASPDFVTIIQPNGILHTSPVAHWNHRFVEVMPGSMVYIHFAEQTFSSSVAELNKLVPALAVHRIF